MPQLFAVLESGDNRNMLRLVMAKKFVENHVALVFAVGYQGSGAWTDYHVVLQMDEWNEKVKYITASWEGEPVDHNPYHNEFEELNDFINSRCDYDKDFIPYLKKEFLDKTDIDGTFEENWDWSDGIHLAICEDCEWPIRYEF